MKTLDDCLLERARMILTGKTYVERRNEEIYDSLSSNEYVEIQCCQFLKTGDIYDITVNGKSCSVLDAIYKILSEAQTKIGFVTNEWKTGNLFGQRAEIIHEKISGYDFSVYTIRLYRN